MLFEFLIALAASLYKYLTAASAEIDGRSYGGGVLELEPTEAERLLVPAKLGDNRVIGRMSPYSTPKTIRNKLCRCVWLNKVEVLGVRRVKRQTPTTNRIVSIAYGNGQFVAVENTDAEPDSGRSFLTSADGTNWVRSKVSPLP